jgi:hypothetical protein
VVRNSKNCFKTRNSKNCSNDEVEVGVKTRKGDKSGVGPQERKKRGNGIKDREDKSTGTEILIVESFTKINPTEPFRLVR